MWFVIFKVEFEISGPNTFAFVVVNNIYLVLEVLADIVIYSVTSGYTYCEVHHLFWRGGQVEWGLILMLTYRQQIVMRLVKCNLGSH
jgi:hypothetical protein